MPGNLLPRPGPNTKIVDFMAPTPDWPDYILPGPDQNETFYHQPEITRFWTTTSHEYNLKWRNNILEHAS